MPQQEDCLAKITFYEPITSDEDASVIKESPKDPKVEIKRSSRQWKKLRRKLFEERLGLCEICRDPLGNKFCLAKNDSNKGDTEDNLLIAHSSCLGIARWYGDETQHIIAQRKQELEKMANEPTGDSTQLTDYEYI